MGRMLRLGLLLVFALSACSANAAAPPVPAGPAAATRSNAARCTGPDSLVADPDAPHGMFVWNPYKVQKGVFEKTLETQVIGKDHTLCGVSLVVLWSGVERSKGTFDWDLITTWSKPYVRAHLRVNLLFAAASEVGTSDVATPAWVFADGVERVQCPGQPVYPNYMNPAFEADWKAFIGAAVHEFSDGTGASPIAPNVEYMRFGIGMGAESLPGHIERSLSQPHPCLTAWQKVGWSYTTWLQHSQRIVDFMGRQKTDKQLMVALNYIPFTPSTIYDYPNALAEAAARRHIGFGTENLGIGHVADPGTTPGPCRPHANNVNLYWCQAFMRHAGQVPFQFQPIVATTDKTHYDLDISNLLQYALDNKTQILELYPQEWVTAVHSTAYANALHEAALVLGQSGI